MGFFRRGFWQKLVIYLTVVLQFGLLVWLFVVWFTDTLNGPTALGFLIFFIILNFLFGIMIVLGDSESSYKISWLFIVGMLPIIGPLLYALFAHKYRTKRQNKYFKDYFSIISKAEKNEDVNQLAKERSLSGYRVAKYLEKATDAVLYAKSELSYFPFGEDMFPKMLEDLKKAKHYIFIEYFIITPGKMWDEILAILEKKVKEGVDVRVIWDDVGNIASTPVLYDKELEKLGIKARVYGKIRPFIDIRYSQRDHRKIMVIDGYIAYTGGVNLADEYINIKNRFGVWKDNAIRVEGEAVYGYTLLFLATWNTNFDPKNVIDYDYYRPQTYLPEEDKYLKDDILILPYGDVPYADHPAGEGAYLSIINNSSSYVYIMTPYLIPTEKVVSSLVMAALSGVEVRIITPGIPDKKAVYQLTRSYYGTLLKAGVKIFEFKEGFIHAKTFVSDDMISTVGTINLDYRSLYLHSENGTLLIGEKVSKEIKGDFQKTFLRSEEISYSTWLKWRKKKRFLWGILRLIAPFL